MHLKLYDKNCLIYALLFLVHDKQFVIHFIHYNHIQYAVMQHKNIVSAVAEPTLRARLPRSRPGQFSTGVRGQRGHGRPRRLDGFGGAARSAAAVAGRRQLNAFETRETAGMRGKEKGLANA